MRSNILLTGIFLILTSCGQMVTDRSFIREMERETDGFFVAERDFEITSGDTGRAWRTRKQIKKRTPASINERKGDLRNRSIKKELAKKVNALSQKDYNHYQSVSDSFKNDSEKIYFLNLSTYEKRNYFLGQRAPQLREKRKFETHHFIAAREIASSRERELYLGMGKDELVAIWGRPYRVDIAGDPRNENERWSFKRARERKIVFLESGAVQGWSLRN